MAESKTEIALGAVACVALAVAVAGFVRDRGDRTPPPVAATTCVDVEAREAVARLRRELALRDGARADRSGPSMPPGLPPDATPGATIPSGGAPASVAGAGEIRRFVHIEVPNPAVTVVQKEDGTYDIKTSDPALAGTILQATATTRDGEVEHLLVRVPP